MNGPGTATHVPVVIAVTGSDSTSPPRTPWQAAWKRLLAGAAIVAPTLLTFIVDPLVVYLSGQTVQLPEAYRQWQPVIAIMASGAVAAYQSLRKQQKESGRLEAAQEMGLADSRGRPTERAQNAVRAATSSGTASQG